MRTIVRELANVRPTAGARGAADVLELTFTARTGEPLICGVEIIGDRPALRHRLSTQPSEGDSP